MYSGYIETASKYGIIFGYGNGNFGPDDKITREQAMSMVARAMDITGLEVHIESVEMENLLVNFIDEAKIADYARYSIAKCIKTPSMP